MIDPASYPAKLIDHFEDPYHAEPIEGETHAKYCESPICGDRVRVSLRIEYAVVQEAGFEAEGCVISQALASMMVHWAEGKSTKQIRGLGPMDVMKMVGGDLPSDHQRCALLPWRTLQAAIDAPVDEFDDEDSSAANFGGPSLSEEN